MTGLISASNITKESNFISSLLFRYQGDGGRKEHKPGKRWRKKVFKIGKKGGLNTLIAASRKVQEGGQHKRSLYKQTALCTGRGWSPGVGCAALWGPSRGIFGRGLVMVTIFGVVHSLTAWRSLGCTARPGDRAQVLVPPNFMMLLEKPPSCQQFTG